MVDKVRELVRTVHAAFLASLCLLVPFGHDADAAIVLDGIMFDNGKGDAELAAPNGVDADSLGNVYVADAWTHRVVKFNRHGQVLRVMGGFGDQPNKLKTPVAVAVGETETFGTLVYVADQANGRVTVFDDLGKYKFTLDEANGVHLNGPHGVGFVANGAGGGFLLVADSNNNRILIFFANGGDVFKEFKCPTCPAGVIRPASIAGAVKGGVFRIYIFDNFTSQVQVINGSNGKWIRSIGEPWDTSKPWKAPQYGHFQAADELFVDDDGNVYVTDTGYAYGDARRVSKFDPSGKFLFEFHSATGGEETQFLSPHGVGIGEKGEIYVASTDRSDVYRFREEPAKLEAEVNRNKDDWIQKKDAVFFVTYNGVEQTCEGIGEARISVPIAAAEPFTVDGGPIKIISFGGNGPALRMNLTKQQVGWLKTAWQQGKKADIRANFKATCKDGTKLRKSISAKL